MTGRSALLGIGVLGLLLCVFSGVLPWFTVDSHLSLPNLHGHGSSSFSSYTVDTLWFWELGYLWPYPLLLVGWALGLGLCSRDYRVAAVLQPLLLLLLVGFIGFQWKLEGLWIPRHLSVAPYVSLTGASLLTIASVTPWRRRTSEP